MHKPRVIPAKKPTVTARNNATAPRNQDQAEVHENDSSPYMYVYEDQYESDSNVNSDDIEQIRTSFEESSS